MHLLLLVVVIPFAILFAGLGLMALTLLMSLVIEFPLTLLVVLAVGVLRHYLANFSAKRAVPCEQM